MTILAWQKKNGDEIVEIVFTTTKAVGDVGIESLFLFHQTGSSQYFHGLS